MNNGIIGLQNTQQDVRLLIQLFGSRIALVLGKALLHKIKGVGFIRAQGPVSRLRAVYLYR